MAELTAVETFLLLEVEGQPKDAFRVASVSGSEGISSLFRYEFELASPEHDLDLQSVPGKKGHLTIKGVDGDRHVHGVVSRFEFVGRFEDLSRYRLALVPSLWVLGLRQDSRIFQDKPIPDIVKQVLKDAGIPDDTVELKVHGEHAPWEYCVQYRESDLAFISRLMEQEGIFYFFVHDEKKSLLRIGDDPSDHPAAPDVGKLPVRPVHGMTADKETVSSFTIAEEVRPDSYAVRDYNFATPAVDLTGTAKEKPGLGTEVFDFPGEYEDAGEGRNLAKLRLQELRATRRRGSGQSNCARLTPGHTFEVAEHARKDHNGKYLITEVLHRGAQPQVLERAARGGASSYGCSFTCIPADVPYRPPRTTPRPMAQGAQTAVVVGPAGEEIHTDEYGRVKVQFHWDRQGKKDENSSCWIRVAQPWAAAKWGSAFIPRIGMEVMVEFLDGDPDQPIVTGAVYNADNQPPYALPGSKTQSGLKSNSSLGGGGSNELRFEDAKGSEHVYLHGQKDWEIVIENDKSEEVKHDVEIKVGNDRSETIGKNRALSVGADKTETVSGKKSISVSKDHTEDIGENMTLSVAKNLKEGVGGDMALSIEKSLTQNVAKDMSLKVGANLDESVADSHRETVKQGYGLKAKEVFVEAADSIEIRTGSASIIMKRSGDIQIKGKKIKIEGSSDVILKGSKISEN